LYKYACGSADGGLFNDGSQTTDKTKRIVFKLVNDITIEDNLVVTADCHIDLNGKTLYLNGNYLALSHAYYGNTVVKNGKIVLDKEVEVVEGVTPNGKTRQVVFCYAKLDGERGKRKLCIA